MSLLSNLQVNPGATKNRKRIGRGIGSGLGKTAGKGHKGQKARSGGKLMPGFEGGQTILARRLPKFGFTSRNKVNYTIVNLDRVAKFDGEVSPEALGLKAGAKLKILGNGEVTKAVTVKAHKFSATAKEAIEKAGGTVEVLA